MLKTYVLIDRSLSCLKRLKTYPRTTVCQERLSNFAMLQIEKKKKNQYGRSH